MSEIISSDGHEWMEKYFEGGGEGCLCCGHFRHESDVNHWSCAANEIADCPAMPDKFLPPVI